MFSVNGFSNTNLFTIMYISLLLSAINSEKPHSKHGIFFNTISKRAWCWMSYTSFRGVFAHMLTIHYYETNAHSWPEKIEETNFGSVWLAPGAGSVPRHQILDTWVWDRCLAGAQPNMPFYVLMICSFNFLKSWMVLLFDCFRVLVCLVCNQNML